MIAPRNDKNNIQFLTQIFCIYWKAKEPMSVSVLAQHPYTCSVASLISYYIFCNLFPCLSGAVNVALTGVALYLYDTSWGGGGAAHLPPTQIWDTIGSIHNFEATFYGSRKSNEEPTAGVRVMNGARGRAKDLIFDDFSCLALPVILTIPGGNKANLLICILCLGYF